ncbi:DUF1015 domain-containing protein [Algoriphagus sediminis]|uniref:DUF1015 domain-containing protein n=1 Tax=Algoriphagus sediminis TaxID=3057113 RepID=A0ABT7YAY4_9BACT|nr:DUF1015 domain-containing protein [Algoriphagus sediminis]MDN3203565.1 DUF1015 domain-containing protein [Algoriphagus sediminis]
MAEILPIKAWRYNDSLAEKLDTLTAPLFDVVSERQRKLLYENPLNSIQISVPSGDNPTLQAKKTLEKWKKEGILKQDMIPGIYIYYQYFRVAGEHDERCRKGFIIQIKAYDWDEKEILRHENTIVSAVGDRMDLLKETKFQASPTHGLYEDPDFQLEGFMDAAMKSPIYELEDYQGVREVVALIHDAAVIRKFLEVIKSKKVILADGHHRLQSAISYRNENKGQTEKEWSASDFHLMYLTNARGNHIQILPTHRLFYHLDISEAEFLEKLGDWFEIKPFSDSEELEQYAFHTQGKFGLVFPENCYLIGLKADRFRELNQEKPEPVRKLDLAILHDALFQRVLGIPLSDQRMSEQIAYERNFSRCLSEVRNGKASFAVITRELEMEQVLEVCNSGEVLPQKSTFFYPKALGGLVMASIDQEEFDFDYGAFFRKTER